MLTTNLTDRRFNACDRANKTPKLHELPFNYRSTEKTDNFHNALLAVLGKAGAEAIEIIRYLIQVGRGNVIWVHYINKYGKKFATFLSPKAFVGYFWNDSNSVVTNLETGARYRVSQSYCDCKSWFHHVRTGKKQQCKHQEMRLEKIKQDLSDSLPVSDRESNAAAISLETRSNNLYKVLPNILRKGLSVERCNDGAYAEYYLKAWLKADDRGEPSFQRIGKIIESDRGFIAQTMTGTEKEIVPHQCAAEGWIIKQNQLEYNADILKAYKESKLPRIRTKFQPASNPSLSRTTIKEAAPVRPRIIRSTSPDVISAFGGFF